MCIEAVSACRGQAGQDETVCKEDLIRRTAPNTPLASPMAKRHREGGTSLLRVGKIVITSRKVSGSIEAYSIMKAGPFFGLRCFWYVRS